MNAIAKFLTENRERHLDELKDLLRIPSVSTGSDHTADVRKAGQWVAARLKSAGCTKVEAAHDRRPSHRLWRVARGAGATDDPGLRALRRAARGSR